MLFTADYISNMCRNAPFAFTYLTTRFTFPFEKSRLQELWEIADTRKGTIVYCFQNGWPIILSMIQFLYLSVHIEIMKY